MRWNWVSALSMPCQCHSILPVSNVRSIRSRQTSKTLRSPVLTGWNMSLPPRPCAVRLRLQRVRAGEGSAGAGDEPQGQAGDQPTGQAPDAGGEEDEITEEDIEILVDMEEELNDEQLETALREWGQTPTGDRESDLLALLPFERTRRSVMAMDAPFRGGSSYLEDPAPLPTDGPALEADDFEAEGDFEEDFEEDDEADFDDPTFAARAPGEAGDDPNGPPEEEDDDFEAFSDFEDDLVAEGSEEEGEGDAAAGNGKSNEPPALSADGRSYEELYKETAAEMSSWTKIDIQNGLRELGMKTTGKKPELLKILAEVQALAKLQGVTPDEVRQRQLRQEDEAKATSAAAPIIEPDLPLTQWSLMELREGVRKRGGNPRGNKRDLIATLQRLMNPEQPAARDDSLRGVEPWAEGGEEEAAAAAAWKSGDEEDGPKARPSETMADREANRLEDLAKGKSLKTAADRAEQKAALNLLTVPEIINFLRGRRIPVGMKKRKDDLVEKLLDSLYPELAVFKEEKPADAPATPPGSKGQELRERALLDRSDLRLLVQEVCPGWEPAHLTEEIEFMPLLDIQKELLEQGLSIEGTRDELATQLFNSRPDLFKALLKLDNASLIGLLERFGRFEFRDETRTEELVTELYIHINQYDWLDDPVSRHSKTGLIQLHPFHNEDRRLECVPRIRIAVVTTLLEGVRGDVALKSAQTVLQHLATAPAHEGLGTAFAVDMYFVAKNQLWGCPRDTIHAASSQDMITALQQHGTPLTEEELMKELKEDSHVVLPIMPEEGRAFLAKIDAAGIPYIGTPFELGSEVAHKAKCRSFLAAMGYPCLPQMHFSASELKDIEEGEQATFLQSRLAAWVEEEEIDTEQTALVVKPALSSSAVGLILARDEEESMVAIAGLLQDVEDVVVEPLLRNVAEFSVLVVESPGGPRASLPQQIHIRSVDEDFLDAELQIERFFTRVKGWTNEDELDASVREAKERTMLANPHLVLYDTEAKHAPTGRVRISSPARLSTEMNMAIRDAAVKAFIDLGLKDIARIDGFVQLPPVVHPPHKPVPQLERFQPKTLEQHKHRLRPNDNSHLVPPWEPEVEDDADVLDEEVAAVAMLLADPNFENMGPYTHPNETKGYHSNDVELSITQPEGNFPRQVKVVEPKLEMDEEEIREHVAGLLKRGAAFDPENYTPDHLLLTDLNDDPNIDSYEFEFDFDTESRDLTLPEEGALEEGGEQLSADESSVRQGEESKSGGGEEHPIEVSQSQARLSEPEAQSSGAQGSQTGGEPEAGGVEGTTAQEAQASEQGARVQDAAEVPAREKEGEGIEKDEAEVQSGGEPEPRGLEGRSAQEAQASGQGGEVQDTAEVPAGEEEGEGVEGDEAEEEEEREYPERQPLANFLMDCDVGEMQPANHPARVQVEADQDFDGMTWIDFGPENELEELDAETEETEEEASASGAGEGDVEGGASGEGLRGDGGGAQTGEVASQQETSAQAAEPGGSAPGDAVEAEESVGEPEAGGAQEGEAEGEERQGAAAEAESGGEKPGGEEEVPYEGSVQEFIDHEESDEVPDLTAHEILDEMEEIEDIGVAGDLQGLLDDKSIEGGLEVAGMQEIDLEALENNIIDFDEFPADEICTRQEGTILIADVNVAPSLEPNGLVFHAAAQAGLTHSGLLRHLVANHCVRHALPLPGLLPVVSAETTFFARKEAARDGLSWADFPSITDREKKLPWYHMRFKERAAEDLELERELLADEFDAFLEEEAAAAEEEQAKLSEEELQKLEQERLDNMTEEEKILMAEEEAWLAEEAEERGEGGAESSGSSDEELDDLQGPLSKQLQDDASDSDGEAAGEEQEEGEGEGGQVHVQQPDAAPTQRVWILCGGEGSDSTASLASGLHAYHELQKEPDMLPELFVLMPPCGGLHEWDRRRELLRRHVERVKITSDPDTLQPPELQLQNIRNPGDVDVDVTERQVWAVPPQMLLHQTVVEIQEACELEMKRRSTNSRLLEEWQRDDLAMRCFTVQQLRDVGVDNAGYGWGYEQAPLAPICVDMYEWAARAAFSEAVVLSTLHSGIGESGDVQGMLDYMGVVYTGSGVFPTHTCSDKGQMAEALASLDMQVVYTPPKYTLQTPQLFELLTVEGGLEALTDEIRDHLGLDEGDAMCIKPANDAGGVGVVKIFGAEDLQAYGLAVRLRDEAITEFSLSWDNPRIRMPRLQPTHFYVEPYIQADSLVMQDREDGTGVEAVWSTPGNYWVEVEIGLLGGHGSMMALPPSILAHRPSTPVVLGGMQEDEEELDEEEFVEDEEEFVEDENEEALGDEEGSTPAGEAEASAPQQQDGEEEKQDGDEEQQDGVEEQQDGEDEDEAPVVERTVQLQGDSVHMCPPPPDVVDPLIVAKAQEKAEVVARQLGLSGCASLQGFLNAKSGDLTVTEVDAVPYLTPGARIFAQAQSHDPPTPPGALLRRLLYIALTERPDGRLEQALEESANHPKVLPPTFDQEGFEALPSEDLGNSQVDPIKPVENLLRALTAQSDRTLGFDHVEPGFTGED